MTYVFLDLTFFAAFDNEVGLSFHNFLFQASANLLIRNKQENAWVFHPELIHIFLLCRNVPLARTNGSKISFGDILRIERHTFQVSFEPVETKVAFRILCGINVVSRVFVDNENDAIVNDEDVNNDVDMADQPDAADKELQALLDECESANAESKPGTTADHRGNTPNSNCDDRVIDLE